MIVLLPKSPVGNHRMKLRSFGSAIYYDRPGLRAVFGTEEHEIECVYSVELRVGNKLHQLFEQLNGAPLPVGSQIDPTKFIGQEFDVLVTATTDNKGVFVSHVAPV